MTDLRSRIEEEIDSRGHAKKRRVLPASEEQAGALRRDIQAGTKNIPGPQSAPEEKNRQAAGAETPEFISRREFARRMEISEKAVRKAIDARRIRVVRDKVPWPEAREAFLQTRVGNNNNRLGELPGESAGSFDLPEDVLRELPPEVQAMLDELRSTEFSPEILCLPWTTLYARYQALEKKEKSLLAKLERQEREGELHHRDDIMSALGDMQIAFRNRIQAIPTKLAKRIADLTGYKNAAAIARILEAETTAALAEMARYDGKKIKSAHRQRTGR